MSSPAPVAAPPLADNRITFRALLLGCFFSGLFAFLTVYQENVPPSSIFTATQLPVLPYILLIVCVALLNPLLRLVRIIRPLALVEVLVIFIMGAVSSGISTFGLASELVPIMSSLFNGFWNNDQSRWDLYIEPYVSESYFVSVPGIQDAAIKYRDAEQAYTKADSTLRAAHAVHEGRAVVARAEAAVQELPADGDPVVRLNRQRQLDLARLGQQQAEKQWERVSAGLTIEHVQQEFPAQVEALKTTREAAKTKLDDLEKEAAKYIVDFRRGLPEPLRAIPGFLYVYGEGLSAYEARVRRLLRGVAALQELRRAEELLRAAGPDAEAVRAKALAALDSCVAQLGPIAALPALEAEKSDLERQLKGVAATDAAVRADFTDAKMR